MNSVFICIDQIQLQLYAKFKQNYVRNLGLETYGQTDGYFLLYCTLCREFIKMDAIKLWSGRD
jgi:hypothetical protein